MSDLSVHQVRSKILGILHRADDGGLTAEEIASQTGVDVKAVEKETHFLADKKLLRQSGPHAIAMDGKGIEAPARSAVTTEGRENVEEDSRGTRRGESPDRRNRLESRLERISLVTCSARPSDS